MLTLIRTSPKPYLPRVSADSGALTALCLLCYSAKKNVFVIFQYDPCIVYCCSSRLRHFCEERYEQGEPKKQACGEVPVLPERRDVFSAHSSALRKKRKEKRMGNELSFLDVLSAGAAHGAAVLVAHAGEAMPGVGQAPAAEVDKQAHTGKGAEGKGEDDQKFSNHEPKSSKWMFSRSTPRFSSMSSTAFVIMGGPHM